MHPQLRDTTMSLCFSSKGSHSHIFRGIWYMLTTDQKEVQALFQIYVVLCLWTVKFAD